MAKGKLTRRGPGRSMRASYMAVRSRIYHQRRKGRAAALTAAAQQQVVTTSQ
jgi:hypothetical protein